MGRAARVTDAEGALLQWGRIIGHIPSPGARADLSDGPQRVLGRVVRSAAVRDAGGGAAGPQDALRALGRRGLQGQEVQR